MRFIERKFLNKDNMKVAIEEAYSHEGSTVLVKPTAGMNLMYHASGWEGMYIVQGMDGMSFEIPKVPQELYVFELMPPRPLKEQLQELSEQGAWVFFSGKAEITGASIFSKQIVKGNDVLMQVMFADTQIVFDLTQPPKAIVIL